MWEGSRIPWWKERAKEDEQAMQGQVRDLPLAITSLEIKRSEQQKCFLLWKKLLC